jgi:hypothetical protein
MSKVRFIFVALILSACSSFQVVTPTPIPSGQLSSDATEIPTETSLTNGEIPTLTPAASPTLTPLAEVILSSTPTQIPTPSYTHMGIELVGENFVDKVPRAAEAGAGWIRWNAVLWANIEPQEGSRNWEQAADFEARAQAVSAAGMNLIAIVRRTPGWAHAVPGYFCGPVLSEKLEAFGLFMHDLVERYSHPPFNVKYWELGNEPDVAPTLSPPDNIFGCWGDETDPYYGGRYYAEMLKIVYPQIKAADPAAQVLVGGLLLDCDPLNPPLLASGEPKDCTPARFLEGILIAGGGDYFDGISFHAYDVYWGNDNGFINGSWGVGQKPGLPASFYKAAYLRALLSQYGYPDKYLINTETALLCGRDQDEAECKTPEFHLTKANYVTQSYVVAKGEGLQANIWYYYQEGWRFSGLVSGSFQPYPALSAYRFAAQTLDGTLNWGTVDEYNNLIGYKFLKPSLEGELEIWVIWSSDGKGFSLTLLKAPTHMYDVLGKPLPPSQTLEITNSPLYLEWNP